MKKKIIILCLLLLTFIPFSAKAYTYKGVSILGQTMIDKSWLTSWPAHTTYPAIQVGPSSSSMMPSFYSFYFHSVQDGGNNYVGYCANIGKSIGNTGHQMLYDDNLNNMHNNLGQSLSSEQKTLLKQLLVHGYHYDSTNQNSISGIVNDPYASLNLMAMQFLVWEIVEGGRTTFSQVAPNVYNDSNSGYNKYIYPNGGAGDVDGSLYHYYKKIITDVQNAINPSDATAFNTSLYNMKWDSVNKRYYLEVTGIGKYTDCKSTNADLKITNISNGISITSTKEVPESTISCSYTVGSGLSDNLYYFQFGRTSGTKCAGEGSCQNVLYGVGRDTYTKSFKVKSESTKLKIKKVGIDDKNLSGAKFRLTHRSNTDYSVTIDGNSNDATTITKSGEYIVSEVSRPTGYEPINDFNIKIVDGKITTCTNQGVKDGNTTCMGDQVEVTYDTTNGVIILKITDVAKNFKIKKVDKDDKPIKGATFQIRNSSNQPMKFTIYKGNIFTYDASGSITNIHLDNSSSYPIALLPEGDYTIVETGISFPYRLSSQESERTTKIKINSNRDMLVYDESQKTYVAAVNAAVKITNYTTKVQIIKTGDGKPLENVKFLLYKEDRETEVRCNMTSSGVYDYVDDQSSIGNTVYITNSTGYITVNYLPVGTYYFKEIETVSPYILPEGEAAYTKVVIDVTKDGPTVNKSKAMDTINISNTKTSFNFYKIDEDGNYLTTGKFKLQKYDEDKKRYVDIKLSIVENDGTYNEDADLFKEDKDGKIQFGLTNGIATFIDMEPSTRYRIVETVAPEGFVRQDVSDTANVTLDAYGNASGLLVLTNQKVLKEDGEAQAELIINIQTGQERIKYGIIIGSLITIIGLLVVLQRKKK